MPEASKPNIHGHIHGICARHLATPEVLKNLRQKNTLELVPGLINFVLVYPGNPG